MDRTQYLHSYYLANKQNIIERIKARRSYIKIKKQIEKPKMEKINRPITINFHM